ncbi:MAG: hypothetical protein JWM09_1376 [Francisellaceae bacterium]|nr:hypothetical protein [Francisellaceae bacterium]
MFEAKNSDLLSIFDKLKHIKQLQPFISLLKYTTFVPFSYVVIYYLVKVAFGASQWWGAALTLGVCLITRHFFNKIFSANTLMGKMLIFALVLVIAAVVIFKGPDLMEFFNAHGGILNNI